MSAATIVNLHHEISYDNETCITCGIVFWFPSDFKRRKISDKTNYYCPNGHSQHYVGESDADKVVRLEREKREKQAALDQSWKQQQALGRQLQAERTTAKKLRRRIKNGTCPCCHRTFKQLAAHMAAKHPGYGDTK